ncbi:hypothetical protein [Pseudovibrio sp. Ad26]|uniref:hypothetical protein n=1 Tax=Pseudovibrio sp. Ad26 TaxID=989410 RepID=UPI0007AED484|nr:hypothetical protein [Pseudovibrio sp. Ad26]KZL09813.1 hypothetical protein PsAD26_03341 [Pseudovibrio sp. Ad26]
MPLVEFTPPKPDRPPRNLVDLKAWMEANCCNFNGYSLDGEVILEGFILRRENKQFILFYTERGTEREISRFNTEEEATQHAYEQLKEDVWAWSHCLAFTKSTRKIQNLKTQLSDKNIYFYEDVIPYGGPADPRYRLFVFGNAIERVGYLGIVVPDNRLLSNILRFIKN